MKKLTGILTILLMICSMGISAFAEETAYIQGDVDMDGILTGHDAAIVSQYADGVLKMSLSDEQLSLADINGDGEVTQNDAAIIAEKQEYILGKVNGEYSDIIRMITLRMLDSECTFGLDEKRADVDCNGVVDFYDMFISLDIATTFGANLSPFDEGKYYYTLTSEKESSFLEDICLCNVWGSDYTNVKDYQDAVSKAYVKIILDIDGDSNVTINDACEVLNVYSQNASGIYQASSEGKLDVNCDGDVNPNDATLVLKGYTMIAAGLI